MNNTTLYTEVMLYYIRNFKIIPPYQEDHQNMPIIPSPNAGHGFPVLIRSSLFRILTVAVTIKCAKNAHSNAQYIPVRGAVIPILF